MKPLLSFCLLLGFLAAALHSPAQLRDPSSTPPGAPFPGQLVQGDIAERLVPNHPGNAGQKVNTSTFAIIESQSMNAGHDMDQEWRTVLLGMGHIPTILPQTTLDNIANLSAYDALIISSGTITLPANRVNTTQQFVQSGRPVYLQGEYLPSYTTDQAFQTIVNGTGGSYAVGSTVSGSLVPTNILNLYATTPNAVAPLSYHWYGCSGAGCNNIEYFMRYGATNIGFVYCPSNFTWGDVVHSTDQDWVRSTTSPALMQNIIFALLSGQACSVVCGSVLQAQHLDLQASPRDDRGVDLVWALDGDVAAGTFVIECNGREIGAMAVQEGEGLVFEFADRRIPEGQLRYQVRHLDQNGNETMSGEASLRIAPAAPTLRVATTATGFTLWASDGAELEGLWMTDINGARREVATGGLHSVQGQSIGMEGMAGGVYFLRGFTSKGQTLLSRAVWIP